MNDYLSSNHHHELGEGILWDYESNLLLFVDILSKKLFRMDIDTFQIKDEYHFDEYIGWVQLTNKKNYYLVGLQSGVALFNLKLLKVKFINKEIPLYPNQRLNDSYIDSNGNLWFGSMEHQPSTTIMEYLLFFQMH